jgi:RimJ/RimL family protein N-acetyltransferase
MRLELLGNRLESERLVLRCFEPSDSVVLFRLIEASREHLERWLVWPKRFASPDDVATWINDVARDRNDGSQSFGMGIFVKPSGDLVGGAGLKLRSFDTGRETYRWFDIGYWLGERAIGRGYAGEAVRLLARHALEDIGADRVEIRVESANAASMAVAERAGFVREGILRNTILRDGLLRDTAIYSIVRDEMDRQG